MTRALGWLALLLLVPAVLLSVLAFVAAVPGASLLVLAAWRHSTLLRRQCAALRSAWDQPACSSHGVSAARSASSPAVPPPGALAREARPAPVTPPGPAVWQVFGAHEC